MAELNLRYSMCSDTSVKNINYQVKSNFAGIDSIDKDFRFATAVTMFGLKLKQSKYISNTDWSFIADFAKSSADTNNYLQREFLNLIEKALKLYDVKSKKKKKKKDS